MALGFARLKESISAAHRHKESASADTRIYHLRMHSPSVSVVMPTFNHAAFIGEAIDSVLAQTFEDWELLVVDNHSTDGTEEVVRARRDPRIRYERFANDGVIARSRNRAIRAARGRYVAFLDSDDVWAPRKLEAQVELMDHEPGLGLVYVLFSKRFPDGRTTGLFPRERHRARGRAFRALYLTPMVANSGAMVRRAALEGSGLLDEDPRLATVEDSKFRARIGRTWAIDYVSGEPLLQYRTTRMGLPRGMSRWTQLRRRMALARKNADHAGRALHAQLALRIVAEFVGLQARDLLRAGLDYSRRASSRS